MIRKLLITSVVIIHLSCGSAEVTMSPKLAKIVPPNLPPLPQDYIVCFNRYWDIKEALDVEVRERWNCTEGCAKGKECCISYEVWDRLKSVKMGMECESGAKRMIHVFLPMALHQIRKKCEPDYEYESDQCRDMEAKVPPVANFTMYMG